MTKRYSLGIDIGGTKILGVGLLGTEVIARVEVPTPSSEGPDAIIDAVAAVALSLSATASWDAQEPPAEYLGTLSGRGIAVVGIGSAGIIDPRTGSVVSATDALAGWGGTRLAERLEGILGVAVHALNDVQALAVAEAETGAGRLQRDCVVIAAGTGIGGAIVSRGRVVLGAFGAAGHVGHIAVPGAEGMPCPCGREGHVEAISSGPAMTDAYTQAGFAAESLRDVAAAAAGEGASSEHARTVLLNGANALGVAIGSLINSCAPGIVILNGGVLNVGTFFIDDVIRSARHTAIPLLENTPIVRAELGDIAVAVGACLFARSFLPGAVVPSPLVSEGITA